MQNILMMFDPATGGERPYPSHAAQWRNWHGVAAWLFDPWTGKRRNAYDVGSDGSVYSSGDGFGDGDGYGSGYYGSGSGYGYGRGYGYGYGRGYGDGHG